MPKSKNIDLSFAFKQPPEKALKYFRSKGYTKSWDYTDTLGAAHAKAFTVAHVARMDVLQDIRGMVDKAISEGITFRQFRNELEPRLKKKGWWGKKFVAGKEPGDLEEVLEGSPHRLKTIYRTNLASAFNAGREEAFQQSKRLVPYGQYIAVLDPKTRDSHAELHGSVFPLDDPFWDSYTPPIDYNCRCRKRALTKRQVEKRGLKIRSSEGRIEKRDVVINQETGEIKQQTFFKLPSGDEVPVQVGFDFNPWKAAWQPDLDSYDTDIARKYIEGTVTGPDFINFFNLKTEGGFRNVGIVDEVDVTDAAKLNTKTITVNKAAMRHIRGHKTLTIEEVQKLQDYASNADLVTLVNDKKLTFYRFINDELAYNTVVDITGGRRNRLKLRTFYRLDGTNKSRSDKVQNLLKEVEDKNGVVVRNRL